MTGIDRQADPVVTGPVTGGTKNRPWSLPQADLDSRGYVAEEYLLEGTARSYRLADGELTPDGKWTAEPKDSAPYRTRILVVRPADAARFNGTAVVQWLNVTAGYELGTADDDELLSGYAWVGVSAQKVGIDGFPPGNPPYRGRQLPNPPLKQWDPARYGSLLHPGDDYSYDMFTQAARAIGPRRNRTVDPMGGLGVDRVVATGASQSGARLTTYINAVHPLERVFDAFLITIAGGWGAPLEAAAVRQQPPGGPRPGFAFTRTRDDIDAPVMVVNSECESVAMYPARRPDSDRYRFWEVAGAPHVVALAPASTPRDGGLVDNPLSYRPVVSAAHRHIHRWLVEGTPPPAQPRIEYASDDPAVMARDERGNAIGGIRLPEMAAPIAEYRGRDDTAEGLGALYGWARPFSADQIRALYPAADVYAKAWDAAVDDLISSGAVRSEDGPAMRARGREVAATLDLDDARRF